MDERRARQLSSRATQCDGRSRAAALDVGGVGGTLAGNALSLAAARATLDEVLTEQAFARMVPLAERFTAGVQEVLDSRRVPWNIVQLGARAEYRFCAPAASRRRRTTASWTHTCTCT